MYLFILVFLFFGYIPKSGIAGSYGISIFSFLKKLYTVFVLFFFFHNGGTNLHSQECTRLIFFSTTSLTFAISGIKKIFFNLFILAMLGLCCCAGYFSRCVEQELLSSCSAGFSCCRCWTLGLVGASVVWFLDSRAQAQ